MTRSWVRLALLLAGIAAIAAAGVTIWSSEMRARATTASLRQAGEASQRALADAAELRAAQQAYVAAGQGEDFWFARVSALSKDLDDVLSVFRGHLSSGEAFAAVNDAAAALQDFQQLDNRAREYTRARQLTQASDVIFADGFDVTRKLSEAIARAMSAERVANDAVDAQRRRRDAMAAGGAAGVAIVVMLLLVPRGGKRAEAPVVTAQPLAPVSKETLDDLSDFGVVARPSPPPPAPQERSVDLQAMASVCAELARVTDTSAIPALLARAAVILDAAGIVLWIADPDGRELSPIVVHGYPPQIAGRLGTIARDAANVTAAAFRTGLLQTVNGDMVSNGAVAAPLVSAGGCLGVMAVEMKDGGERREPLLAAATIVAAQLSTLVGPPSTRARAEAAG